MGSMVATAVLLVVLIGTCSLRYSAMREARKAAVNMTAARLAATLCESWRGLSGDETYSPIAHLGSAMTINESKGLGAPEDFTLLGNYAIALDGSSYYATLSWKDVATGLRALNVTVAWDPQAKGQSSAEHASKSFQLTSYCICDG